MELGKGVGVKSYVLLKKIGQGASGLVFRAKKEQDSSKRFALKFIPVKYERMFLREVEYLEEFKGSTNIVELIESFIWEQYCVIVQELLFSDLLDYPETSKSSSTCKIIFKQICSAIKALHDNGIAHRDIKPENIFLNHHEQVKIGDLGTCIRCEKDILEPSRGVVGTKFYCAPEIIARKNYSPIKADIWSLGVTLHVLLTGTWPFNASSKECLIRRLDSGTARVMVHEHAMPNDSSLVMLLYRMLHRKPSKRPTIDEVLSCRWLKDCEDIICKNQSIYSQIITKDEKIETQEGKKELSEEDKKPTKFSKLGKLKRFVFNLNAREQESA